MSEANAPVAETAPQRRVMVVEDDPNFGKLLRFQLQREGLDVHIVPTGDEALGRFSELEPDIVLLDVMLPGKDGTTLLSEIHQVDKNVSIVMMTAAGSVDMAVECMKKGAYDFLTKPFDFDRLHAIIRNGIQHRDLKVQNQVLAGALDKHHGFDQIIAHSPRMRQLVDQARRASMSDSDVLVLGESGSGKEVLARAIHFNSPRKRGPFVAINCGAIPESLLESELFGHEKGAFTGAVQRRTGCFEQAHGGTLFLDEIGEMRPDMQVRLLRALENREIRRVGGDRTIRVNTRVISATNQNITQNLKNNTFRADLYYRLAILVLEVAPLRDRPDDIAPLAQFFLDDARKDGHTRAQRIAPEALQALVNYQWPGNVRELRNAIERAVVYEDSTVIQPSSLPPEIVRATLGPQAVPVPKLTETYTAEQFKAMLAQSNAGRDAKAARAEEVPPAVAPGQFVPAQHVLPVDASVMRGPADGEVLTLDEEEKRIILRTLSITGGNISEAARRLAVHRSTLHRKMTRYGLATDEQLAADTVGNSEA
ncbi:MAG TPA: sigma-54 dependent transcriptional regulator [Planctomycetota bacterium]|nr:sigma-54 dependent transcriptional regulator [Planctomycetota bacterium]